MQALAICRIDPELKQVVREASQALALLDANRLEELACACRALRCDRMDPAELRRQAREATAEMAVLARVLDATRANLQVMNRLKDLREGRIFYAEIDGGRVGEAADGND
jgi:hypothetical protein